MRRAAFTIGEKKGRGFGNIHPEEWILEEPRRDLKGEVQEALQRKMAAARASMSEEKN